MRHPSDANAPAPPAPGSDAANQAIDDRAPSSDRDDTGTAEEQVRDVDPHPDTPDDFDEDASSPRESIEAVHDAGGASDDD